MQLAFSSRRWVPLGLLVTLLSLTAEGQTSDSSDMLFADLCTDDQWSGPDCCDDAGSCDGLASSCDGLVSSCDAELSCRERWADNGITFQNQVTQFYFGTVAGGLDETDRYGGHGDYLANFDFGKLGVQEGLFLKIRAEHRFGRSIVEPVGALLPATLATELPSLNDRDLHITNFLLTQALSESFIVFAGKVDTLDGDINQFAHGRGLRQFSNVSFVANPIALRTIPYASLGAGFAFLQEGEPLFSFLLINPTDTATSSGFDELFSEGVAASAELRVPTRFGGLAGHQLVGATYSNRNYVNLDQDPRIVLPTVPIGRSTGSWSAYWNMDQYLKMDPCDSSRGWGYFARAGIADDRTNPISYFLSGGLGGNSPVRSRGGDTFGVGYYYSGTSGEIGPVLSAVLGGIGDGQGVEAFYNFALTDTLTITPDFQWISQARQSVDDAYLMGVRANLVF